MNSAESSAGALRRVGIIHLEDNPFDQELVAAMLQGNGSPFSSASMQRSIWSSRT